MMRPIRLRTARRERGSQLFEFALVLPMLLLLIAGVADFAQGWNLRQVLANAARDGARLGSNENYSDLTDANPMSIQTICQQVADYLIQEHVNPAFMGISGTSSSTVSSGCSSFGTVVDSTTGLTVAWTYYSTGNYGLKIEPQLQVHPPGETCGPTVLCIASTRVTLKYPYNWTLGTNLIGMTSSNSTVPIQVYSVISNNTN